MIITELGIDQVNHAEQVTITRVVFSDLSLKYVINPASLTGVTGGNTASVEPVVGLLYNGTINLQAINDNNFSAQSAFIFAKGNEEFLIAVSPVANNRINGELNINKIRKLSFNALASDLVLKPEVNSVVAKQMTDLLQPNLSSIANGVADSVSSTVASKFDNTILSDYVTNKSLKEALASAADVSAVNDIKTELNNKASKADLTNYYQNSVASDSFKSVNSALDTKAKASDFSQLSSSQKTFAEWAYIEIKKYDGWITNNNNEIINNRNAMASSLAQVQRGFDNLGASLNRISSNVAILQSQVDYLKTK